MVPEGILKYAACGETSGDLHGLCESNVLRRCEGADQEGEMMGWWKRQNIRRFLVLGALAVGWLVIALATVG